MNKWRSLFHIGSKSQTSSNSETGQSALNTITPEDSRVETVQDRMECEQIHQVLNSPIDDVRSKIDLRNAAATGDPELVIQALQENQDINEAPGESGLILPSIHGHLAKRVIFQHEESHEKPRARNQAPT